VTTRRIMRVAIMDMEVRARWAACIRVMAVNMARMGMGMGMGIIRSITVTRGAEVGVEARTLRTVIRGCVLWIGYGYRKGTISEAWQISLGFMIL